VPPFEFRALEVALEAICSFLDARTIELETNAYPALDELTKKVRANTLSSIEDLLPNSSLFLWFQIAAATISSMLERAKERLLDVLSAGHDPRA